MKIINGMDLVNLWKSLADLAELRAELRARCNTRYSCKNGHEINGSERFVDETTCRVCHESLLPIGPVTNPE